MRITPVRVEPNSVKVRLCGQFTKEYVAELEDTLAGKGAEGQSVALDLANVTFVDREAMVFLCSAKSKNIVIENCPSYVVRWIEQECLSSGSSSSSNDEAQQTESAKP